MQPRTAALFMALAASVLAVTATPAHANDPALGREAIAKPDLVAAAAHASAAPRRDAKDARKPKQTVDRRDVGDWPDVACENRIGAMHIDVPPPPVDGLYAKMKALLVALGGLAGR